MSQLIKDLLSLAYFIIICIECFFFKLYYHFKLFYKTFFNQHSLSSCLLKAHVHYSLTFSTHSNRSVGKKNSHIQNKHKDKRNALEFIKLSPVA